MKQWMWATERMWWGVATICAAIMAISASGCGIINVFPLDQDAQLGLQIDQEIRNNPAEYPILNNESVRGYVQGIVNQIIQSPQIKYRGKFPYKVTIINDDKTLNAFATPGGYIYVYTGILKYLENEASLAGVLGHEVAHAEERHGTQHMSDELGIDILLAIALGNNPTQLAQVAGSAGKLLTTLANSRSDETEADTRSFAYLQSTPYWPGSIKSFFEKLLQQGEGARTGGKLAEWTSTHPLPTSRVDHINQLLKDNNIPAPTAASLRAEPYRQMLKQLR
jgi:beta-barrel assembly-enhancing protease